jgi:anti-sigma factor RsiW
MGVDRCRWVRGRLALLAGDDWLGSDRRRVERHLIGCSACRRHLETSRNAVEVLRAAGAVAPALSSSAVPVTVPSLWPALARQIQESRRPESAWGQARWGRTFVRSGLGIAAVVLAVCALGARRDIRTQVTRMLVQIRFSSPAASFPKRVTIQTAPPASDFADEDTSMAESSSSSRGNTGDLVRVPSPSPDVHSAEPTR